jgi:hypothetical protein
VHWLSSWCVHSIQGPAQAVGLFAVKVRAERLALGQRVCDPNVADSEAQDVNNEPLTVANDPTKRWRGGKGSSVRMDERMNFAYAAMLEGGTRRQVLQKVMDRFGVSEVTAGRDYSAAMQILKTEQIETRENLLNQIQALRLATVQKALRKGQLQTVAMLLKDMGAVIGEAAPEQQAAAAPRLEIVVEDKRADA